MVVYISSGPDGRFFVLARATYAETRYNGGETARKIHNGNIILWGFCLRSGSSLCIARRKSKIESSKNRLSRVN